ncbi:MAG: MBL fold metallo-hydrolase [Terrimicrobiaceae bacterium]
MKPPTDKPLPLEDNHLDIIGKARRGWKCSDLELVSRAAITLDELQRVEAGEILPEVIEKLAPALHLSPGALLASAQKSWRPHPIEIDNFKTFTTPFGDMTVNSYMAWDSETKEAVVFDSGADASGMLEFAGSSGLKIRLILITHTHGDHIFDLDRLIEKTGAPAYVGDRETALTGTHPFAAGKCFQVGKLAIESRLTWGHADGGITYVVTGLARRVAVAGDAIFSGSMGGGKSSWLDALRTTREEILSLPGETVLAPGHGPLTTVAEEKIHNPFFAN